MDGEPVVAGVTLEHHLERVNGIDLHWVSAGRGPLVVLLHGFPDFWYTWRHQIPALVAVGYQVVAPDLRGANRSGKPARVRSYRFDLLVADIAALVRHLGYEQADIVGHDVGGGIAWLMPALYPGLVRRAVVLNCAHPLGYVRQFARDPSQWARSAYMGFFQLPALPETVLRSNDWAPIRQLFRTDPLRPFAKPDIDAHVAALARPGAMGAMLNWYRALRHVGPVLWQVRAATPATAPTLLVWGERDRFAGTWATRNLDTWVADLRVERLPAATHWVQHDAPHTVNRLLLEHLRPPM